MIARAFKASIIAAFSTGLLAAGEPVVSDYPEPPAAIAERIVDGRFEPGNFEYLRGFFPEATPQEKADYAEIVTWIDKCGEEGIKRLRAELVRLDLTLHEEFSLIGAANLCGQVTRGERFEDFASYKELLEASRGARLVFNTLVESTKRAEQRSGPVS